MSKSEVSRVLTIAAMVATCAVAICQIRPEPPPRRPQQPVPAEASGEMSAGKKMVWDALALQGGGDKLARIKDFSSEINVEIHTDEGTDMLIVEETWSRPDKLRTLVTEEDNSLLETAWNGKLLSIRSRNGQWRTMTADEAGKDYRDTRENLRRIDRLLGLFSTTAEFKVLGTRRVHIFHTGSKNFTFLLPGSAPTRPGSTPAAPTGPGATGPGNNPATGPGAPAAPNAPGASEDESILDLQEIERIDPTATERDAISLFINRTKGHVTEGYVVGVAGRNLDGSSRNRETIWFKDFMPSTGDKTIKIPRTIQIYRDDKDEGWHEIQSFVEIYEFHPDKGVKDSFFSPR